MQTQNQTAAAATRKTALEILSMEQYLAIPGCYRSVWSTERTDMPEWDKMRHLYIGQKTMMRGGSLDIQGMSFVIKEEDNGWYEIVVDSGRVACVQGIKKALDAGAKMAMLANAKHHETQLRETGHTMWSYGFSTVEIVLVNAFHCH